MPKNGIDFDVLHDRSCMLPGEVALWLAVTIDAFFSLRDNDGCQSLARSWIDDPGNDLFEALCEEMGFTPEGLRERIWEAVKKT